MTGRRAGGAPLPYRLLVVSRVVAARTGDGLRFQALDGRYIDGIARQFESARVAAQAVVEGQHEGYPAFAAYAYRFATPRLSFTELPMPRAASPGILATLVKQVRQWWRLRREVLWCDLAFVFLPSYAGVLAAWWCRVTGRPYAVYLGGDWGGYSPLAFRWRGWRALLLRPYAWLNALLERLAVRGAALAIVSGAALLQRYSAPGRAVVRTEPLASLSAADVFPREDTCSGELCHLLFVGALLPGKGLQHLLAALPRLPGFALDVVGAGRARFQAELQAFAERERVADRVCWHGYVADPLALRDLYRSADIFVLPTLSEGSPRVIWEAMSQGLPVVASDIPAIRATLEPDVDIVAAPPADPGALAAAIRRVRQDQALRRALIARGLQTARRRLGRDASEQAIALLREHVVPRVRP